jgi:2-polyprenyl-3-methyl-5-hydroxy-6-metoxy-1,4-benzoquinol methylase
MKYYEMHEEAYSSLKKNNYISWDRETDVSALFNHDINFALEKVLNKYFSNLKNLKSLDLGCGTGTVALFLANKGFQSTGYDISNTAIFMARENAIALDLKADLMVADINELKVETKFDLIVDSSFFHCIVKKDERQAIFKSIILNLQPDGYFFVHTMIQSEDMSDMLSSPHLVMDGETLWSTGPDRWEMNWSEVNGKKVFPHRIIKTKKDLEAELIEVGFDIVEYKENLNLKNPSVYTALLKVR